MKINQLLSGTNFLLIQNQCDYSLYPSKLVDRVLYAEKNASLAELNRLFQAYGNMEVTFEVLNHFVNFLKNRWELISGTPLAYPYSLHLSITQICETLADEILRSGLVSQHKFKILMPTLQTYNEVTLLDLNETNEDLSLHHYILSDDNCYLINVVDAITDAKHDNVLKHTNVLAAGKAKLLSLSEKKRLIDHSQEAKKYYEEIQKFYAAKNNGGSIGAAIKRLINRLREGGAHGRRGGTDDVAGEDAIIGIKEFYFVMSILTPNEKEMLYACSSTRNAHKDFKVVWFHLLSRVAIERNHIDLSADEIAEMLVVLFNTANSSITTACVELFASDFETILTLYPELYNIYPENVEVSGQFAIEMHERWVDEAKVNLERVDKSSLHKSFPRYEKEDEDSLIKKVFTGLVASAISLKDLLYNLTEENVKTLLETVGKNKLHDILDDMVHVRFLFRSLQHASNIKDLIIILGKEFFHQKIVSAHDLHMMAIILPISLYNYFFNETFGKQNVRGILQNNNDVNNFLSGLELTNRKSLCKLLDIKWEDVIQAEPARFFQSKNKHESVHKNAEESSSSQVKRRRA